MNMNDVENIVFYYLRKNDNANGRGTPYGVVAVRENEDGTVNRGVSLCSPDDKYDKNAGRGIALKRLIKAESDKRSTEFGVYTGVREKKKMDYDIPFSLKSAFHELITKEEHRMFHKPKA